MKKFYSILLLLIIFTFLTTYNPSEIEFFSNKNNSIFNIKNIKITNNKKINEGDIESKITEIYGKNIFFVKTKDIKNVIKNINFLDTIEVKKKYPNTIIVKIFETKPVGILFKDKDEYLLDSSANLIEIESKEDFTGLPNIIGNDAENNITNFLDQLKANKFPINNIKNFSYFKIGRWDIELLDNRTIKFPHNADSGIIKKTIELLRRKDFQNYKIIDLRIDGKIIVE